MRIILDKASDNGITKNVFETMRTNLPERWQEIEVQEGSQRMQTFMDQQKANSSAEEFQQMETALDQLTSVWLVGNKVESVYAGLDSQGLSTLRVQLGGARLSLYASVTDLLAYFPEANGSVKDALGLLQQMSASELPDSFAFPSLTAVHAKTGDVVFVPPGFVCIEKAIVETSIAARRNQTTI